MGQLLQWWSRIHAPLRAPRLYRLAWHSMDPEFLIPRFVPKARAESLDPRASFVLHTEEQVFAWHGTNALPRYREAAHRVHKQLFKYEGASSACVDVEQVSVLD